MDTQNWLFKKIYMTTSVKNTNPTTTPTKTTTTNKQGHEEVEKIYDLLKNKQKFLLYFTNVSYSNSIVFSDVFDLSANFCLLFVFFGASQWSQSAIWNRSVLKDDTHVHNTSSRETYLILSVPTLTRGQLDCGSLSYSKLQTAIIYKPKHTRFIWWWVLEVNISVFMFYTTNYKSCKIHFFIFFQILHQSLDVSLPSRQPLISIHFYQKQLAKWFCFIEQVFVLVWPN